jgi:hypothetical protein
MIQKKIMSNKQMILIICSGLMLLTSCQNKNAGTELLSEKTSPEVFVFYFHRTVRCSTCLEIEAGAAKVIKENFSQFLADGFIKWVPFNIDDEGGDEFAKQFDVNSNTLVVAKISKDRTLAYKKLEDVWQHVGNTEKFSKYVTDEINIFIKSE